MHRFRSFTRLTLTLITLFVVMCSSRVQAVTILSPSHNLAVTLDAGTGLYQISAKSPVWTLSGTLRSPAKQVRIQQGRDQIGDYQKIVFTWTDKNIPLTGSICLYDQKPLLLFAVTNETAAATAPAPFPDFTTSPPDLYHFSYRDTAFAPPAFSLEDTSTPWLLFDDQDNALILSPAAHFQIASLIARSGQTSVLASGFNPHLRDLPAGFTQKTLLAISHGINHTWDVWGKAMTDLGGKTPPSNQADPVLKYFGYWTDNGAAYYYNYDPALGYTGTLAALTAQFQQHGPPLHYLQLDSWWYEKSLDGPDGRPLPTKHSKFPSGEWNRPGGLLDYTADKALFPNGLASFHQEVGLPFVAHNRWIDRSSPYRQQDKISGIAAVDPKWWNNITAYLQASGVITYEQDWLDNIYRYSPEFSSTVGTADAFMDDMAAACQAHSLEMQYCMALPCDFLQGSRYANLTTIRASNDRFQRSRWHDFLYTSRLASALGIWPWTDVFKSSETENLLLADLSGGPVGVGDQIGHENWKNIAEAIRTDGVIVKPDTPLTPLDQTFLSEARGDQSPLLAEAQTTLGPWKTAYVFAFTRSATASQGFQFSPKELGITSPAYVYDDFSGTGQLVDSGNAFSATLNNPQGTGYYIIAPVGPSGIAFLGDAGKFVSLGRQRIARMTEKPGELKVVVLFAPQEASITLHGFAASPPRVTVTAGTAEPVRSDQTKQFFFTLHPDMARPPVQVHGDLVRRVTVILRTT